MVSTVSSRRSCAAARTAYRLTPQQLRLLRFIQRYRNSHGCSPTLNEIAAAFQVSRVTIFGHAEALVRQGLLQRSANKVRSLVLDGAAEVFLAQHPEGNPVPTNAAAARPALQGRFPLAGVVAAGVPFEACEQVECLDLGTLCQGPHETYVLQVRGDSMIGEHICDGDYVIIEKRCDAREGQIVVAMTPEGEVTLKKFYREAHGIRLESANPDYKPIYLNTCVIRGIMIGVIRRY